MSKRIFIYAKPATNSNVLTGVDSPSFLSIKQRLDGWALVTSDFGFPIWIPRSHIEPYGRSLAKITRERNFAYARPDDSSDRLDGKLSVGEMFPVIRKEQKWMRVWSPKSFMAWARLEELE